MGGPDLPSTFPFRNWHPTPPHRLPELTTPCQIELLSRCPAWQSPGWEGTLCLRSPVCVAPSLGDYRHSLSEPRWELLDDPLAPSSPPVPSASVLSPSDVAGELPGSRLLSPQRWGCPGIPLFRLHISLSLSLSGRSKPSPLSLNPTLGLQAWPFTFPASSPILPEAALVLPLNFSSHQVSIQMPIGAKLATEG